MRVTAAKQAEFLEKEKEGIEVAGIQFAHLEFHHEPNGMLTFVAKVEPRRGGFVRRVLAATLLQNDGTPRYCHSVLRFAN